MANRNKPAAQGGVAADATPQAVEAEAPSLADINRDAQALMRRRAKAHEAAAAKVLAALREAGVDAPTERRCMAGLREALAGRLPATLRPKLLRPPYGAPRNGRTS